MGFAGASMSGSTILSNSLAAPIIRLDSSTKGMQVSDFTVRYESEPGVGDTAAYGIQTDNFFHSTLERVQILQTYIGFGTVGTTGPWLFFSNTIDDLVIRDVYQSHIRIHVGSSGANTGNRWGNIYLNGRAFDGPTIKTIAGPMVQLSTSDGESFQQLNLEYAETAIEYFVLVERGALSISHMHVEGLVTNEANTELFNLSPNGTDTVALTVLGLQFNAVDWNTSGWSNLVKFNQNNASATFVGVVDKQSGTGNDFGSNGLRPGWTGGVSRSNCSLSIRDSQLPNLQLTSSADSGLKLYGTTGSILRQVDLGTGVGLGPLEQISGWVADNLTNPTLGTLPVQAYVINVRVHVTQAFDSDGTDEITVGYDGGVDAFMTALDVSTTGVKATTLGSGVGYSGTARLVEAYYTAGGSAPTLGKALVIVEYYRGN